MSDSPSPSLDQAMLAIVIACKTLSERAQPSRLDSASKLANELQMVIYHHLVHEFRIDPHIAKQRAIDFARAVMRAFRGPPDEPPLTVIAGGKH